MRFHASAHAMLMMEEVAAPRLEAGFAQVGEENQKDNGEKDPHGLTA